MRRLRLLVRFTACLALVGSALLGASPALACSCGGGGWGDLGPTISFTARAVGSQLVNGDDEWTFDQVGDASSEVGPRPVVRTHVAIRELPGGKVMQSSCHGIREPKVGRRYRVVAHRGPTGLYAALPCAFDGGTIDELSADATAGPVPASGADDPAQARPKSLPLVAGAAAAAAAAAAVSSLVLRRRRSAASREPAA